MVYSLLCFMREKKVMMCTSQGSAQQLQNLKVQRQLQLFQKQAVGGSQRVALQPVAGGKVTHQLSWHSIDQIITHPNRSWSQSERFYRVFLKNCQPLVPKSRKITES